MTAFAVAAGLAGLAGGLLAGLEQKVNPIDHSVTESLDVVALTIIGGVGSAPGAVLGALWVHGLPAFVGFTPKVDLLRNGIGFLLIILYFPGGLLSIWTTIRDQVVQFAARRHRAGMTSPDGFPLAGRPPAWVDPSSRPSSSEI